MEILRLKIEALTVAVYLTYVEVDCIIKKRTGRSKVIVQFSQVGFCILRGLLFNPLILHKTVLFFKD